MKTKENANETVPANYDKYRIFFDSNRDSITMFRLDSEGNPGKFIEANPATTALFGYTKKELLSLSILDIEKIPEKIREARIKALLTEGKTDFETIIKDKKGNERFVEIETIIINYENEPAVMNITRDVTERKQIEGNSRKAHENLTTLLEAIPDLLFEVGMDSKIYYYQAHRQDLLAVTPDQIIGKYFKDIMPADVSEICFAAMKEADEQGWSIGKQYSLQLQHGKHWFELSVSPIHDKSLANKRFIILARDINERKLAEEKLLASESLLNQTQNIAHLGSYFLDFTTGIWTSSAALNSIFGIDDTTEKTIELWVSIVHPEWRTIMTDYLNKEVIGNRSPFNKEYKIITLDTKQERWVHGMGEISFNPEGEPLSLIGSIQDITERKLAEEALRESEEKFRGLVENSPDGIVTYVQDKIAYANSEALRIVKANSYDQIIGKCVLEFVHPDSTESVIQRMKEVVLDDHASQIAEEKLITISGEMVYAELKAIPTLFNHQNAVQVIIHDITERKRTQEKIKQLSQAVEQSPVAIVITNTSGAIEYANPKFIETTGYSYDEIIGNNPRFLKSGHTTPNEYKHLWQTLTSGNEWYGEFHNKKKDGTLYWESASISPILNSQGITTHYIAIKEDITERKLIEQQLIKAKEKAEESDRLKLAFWANMSHEIRTPMNGILGFTELLKDQNLSEDVQQEYIKIIEKSGKRMLNIINDIINISKVESGQIEVTPSETNLNEQCEYLLTFFKPEAAHKNISLFLTKELSSKDTFIKTDREKLYAILTNLIKNAIKFTNEGSIEFGCVKKGKFLEFFVKDSGMGISDSQKKIVFERFRQANDTVTRSHEGSGLGLAISKAYVEMQGGKIWVESKEGIGSTFYFTLPFHSAYELKEKIITDNTNSNNLEDNKINDLKVLIVEDDAISKLLITIAVKPYSREIIKVSTGFEAVEACRNNPDIDLVMMDINMPEMGGYEATKKIRKFNKDLVIIAQTANGMQSDHDKALSMGCTDYISKPVNITSLSKLIQKYFKK